MTWAAPCSRRKGEISRAYLDGMEDQLSALGLIPKLRRALESGVSGPGTIRATRPGLPGASRGRRPTVAFVREHIRMEGHCSFHLPEFGEGHRPLCDPDAPTRTTADRGGRADRRRGSPEGRSARRIRHLPGCHMPGQQGPIMLHIQSQIIFNGFTGITSWVVYSDAPAAKSPA